MNAEARHTDTGSEAAKPANSQPTLLEARGLTKAFGDFLACDHIDFSIRRGEIHALLGENGAGKSTFVKMLYGALQPTSGEIRWKGEPVSIDNPATARRLGIGMVFQHFSLFDVLTVAENIALALAGKVGPGALAERIRTVSRDYGLPLDPMSIVADLSVGERQRVEIVRCLLQEPDLIIMDEPTSVLTPHEAEDLFRTLARLTGEGVAILYISHRLEEVKRLCHAATILRHGKVVGSCDPAGETPASLARMMVGADVREVRHREQARLDMPVRLELKHLSLPPAGPFSVPLVEIDLAVRGGEVVAIAGVAGNGQGELFDALSGERPLHDRGALVIDGHEAGRMSVGARRRLGAAFVPEERLGHAAVPGLKLSENVVLTRHGEHHVVRGGFLKGGARAIADRVVESFDVRKSHRDPEARSLSGGNLQKFVVGREIDRQPGVLVVSQPTWGVDAGASADIRQALVDLARAGSAVLVISQDLDEIFEVADRIAVVSRGRLSAPVPAATTSRDDIGLLMGGIGHGGEGASDAA